MNFELWILLGAVLLGLIHVSAQSFSFKAQAGNRYTIGPRDKIIKPGKIAARLERASANYLETFSYFAACIIVVHLSDSNGHLSSWGSVLYLAGRIAYLPLYAVGVPWLRTISWNIATFGLVLIGIQPLAFMWS